MAAIAGEGQEIDLLALRDVAMPTQIWEFRSSHPNFARKTVEARRQSTK